jgi:CO dehydrogenase nickel-insertion accessory protein CooC1
MAAGVNKFCNAAGLRTNVKMAQLAIQLDINRMHFIASLKNKISDSFITTN